MSPGDDLIEIDPNAFLDADSEFALLSVDVTFRVVMDGPSIPDTLGDLQPLHPRVLEYPYELPRHLATSLIARTFFGNGASWEVTATKIVNRDYDSERQS